MLVDSPVVDEGKLVGMITHRDILLAGGEALTLKVDDLMSKDLMVADKKTPIVEITKIMADKGYQRIPVIDDHGDLVGTHHPKQPYTCACRSRLNCKNIKI